MRLVTAVLVAVVVCLGASAGAAAIKAPKAKTAAALAAAIQGRGLGCDDFKPTPANGEEQLKLPGVPQGDEGDCTIDSLGASVSVFKNARYAKAAAKAIPGVVCAFAKPFGVTSFELVHADNWVISFPNVGPAKSFAKQLGASRTIKPCK